MIFYHPEKLLKIKANNSILRCTIHQIFETKATISKRQCIFKDNSNFKHFKIKKVIQQSTLSNKLAN